MATKPNSFKRNCLALGIASTMSIFLAGPIGAAEANRFEVDIAQSSAGIALLELAEKSGAQIVFSQNIGKNITLSGLKGEHTLSTALDEILAGSGLVYEFLSNDSVVIKSSDSEDSNSSEPEEADVEEIVVVGSRLKGNNASGSPVTTFNREDLERGGYTSIQDVFRRLPQNLSSINPESVDLFQREVATLDGTTPLSSIGASSANLRGLGSSSTLILIDGRRKARSANANGAFVDISSIPLSQVERIEILTDGASAIYGADAVSGVINIVLRKNYEGAELNVRHEDSGSAANLTRLTGNYGFSWDGGKLAASIDLSEKKSADTNQFVHSGPTGPGDFTDLNGTNQRLLGFDPVNPSVYALGIHPLFGFLTYDSTAPLQTGAGGSVFQRPNVGPATEAETFRLYGDQLLGDNLVLDFDMSYTRQEDARVFTPQLDNIRELFRHFFVSDISGRNPPLKSNERIGPGTVIPGINPNNPFGVDVIAAYTWAREFALMSPLSEQNSQDDKSFSLGLAGDVAFMDGWDFRLDYSYSDSEGMQEPAIFYGVSNVFLPDEVRDRIENFFNTVNIFSGDPADAAANAAALETLINHEEFTRFNSNAQALEGVLRTASLFSLPAGDVGAVIGFQRREDTSFQQQHYSYFTPEPNSSNVETTSFFAEFNVPLLSDLPLIQDLTLNIAARHEKVVGAGMSELIFSAGTVEGPFRTGDKSLYSLPDIDMQALTGFSGPDVTQILGEGFLGEYQSGRVRKESTYSATSPSLKLSWKVNDDLHLRASWGESFLAPQPSAQFGRSNIRDDTRQFVFGGGIYPDSFTADGTEENRVVSISGVNPNLKAQTATTLTYGFDYDPTWADGLSLKATYNRITYDNFISTFPKFGTQFLEFSQNVEEYPETFISTTGEGAVGIDNVLSWDQRARNVAKRLSEAVDMDVRYTFESDIGDWDIILRATRTLQLFNLIDERVEPFIFADSESGPGKWKGNLEVSWTGGEYSATAIVNYEDDARVLNPLSAVRFYTSASGPDGVLQNKSGSYTTVDFQLAYAPDSSGWLEGMKISLGAQNLFKPDFPFVDNRIGYVASKVNSRGRVFYMDIRKSFDFN